MNETVKETILALGLIGIIALGGCTKAEETTAVQLPAPFHEVASEDIAANETGIELNAPDSIAGLSDHTILVFNDEKMVEVTYTNGDGTERAMIRKAAKENYDSGDYSSYVMVEEITTAGGIVYTAYENDGKVYRGEWNDGSYVSGLMVDSGMEISDFSAVVDEIG